MLQTGWQLRGCRKMQSNNQEKAHMLKKKGILQRMLNFNPADEILITMRT